MNRYSQTFECAKQEGRKAFVPFTVLGYPNKKDCLAVVQKLIDSGATALELGIPFSDPVADGPIIQRATYEVLASGFKIQDAFDLLAEIRKINNSIPIGLLVYYNLLLSQGVARFYERCKNVGVDGVLVADLPIEHADEVLSVARSFEIDPIFIVSPVTGPERLKKIVASASGFLYLISRLGVTGITERDALRDDKLSRLIETIRETSSLPILAGFGVSSPSDAKRMIAAGADGVITGSKIVHIIETAESEPDNPTASALTELGRFVDSMLSACSASINGVDHISPQKDRSKDGDPLPVVL